MMDVAECAVARTLPANDHRRSAGWYSGQPDERPATEWTPGSSRAPSGSRTRSASSRVVLASSRTRRSSTRRRNRYSRATTIRPSRTSSSKFAKGQHSSIDSIRGWHVPAGVCNRRRQLSREPNNHMRLVTFLDNHSRQRIGAVAPDGRIVDLNSAYKLFVRDKNHDTDDDRRCCRSVRHAIAV